MKKNIWDKPGKKKKTNHQRNEKIIKNESEYEVVSTYIKITRL